MNKNTSNPDKDSEHLRIQWHPAFCSAMYLELRENNHDLEHHREFNLNTKPIMIDLLIIRKLQNVEISNDIGKIFRTYNIFEYKSPGDRLNADVFYKALAYAFLYKSGGIHTDEIPADEITVSLVRECIPRELIKYWKCNGFIVTNPYSGIYYIDRDGLPPIQLVVSEELNELEHLWLKALKRGVNAKIINEMASAKSTLCTQKELDSAYSVFNVAIAASRKEEDVMRAAMNFTEQVAREAETNGIISTYAGLIHDNILSVQTAARRMNMTEHEFIAESEKLGFQLTAE